MSNNLLISNRKISKIDNYQHISSNNKKVFDPRIIDENNNYRLWTTESVILADKGIKDGYKLIESPYNSFVKDAKLRRANIAFRYADEEMAIIRKCIKDKIFFANNFVSLKDADKGWQRIKLRDYQINLLERYTNNNRNIVMFPRQSGKTTTTIIEIVHFLSFNYDKDCVVVAKSSKVIEDILGKIKQAFNSLPFFLQPGFISFTKNGCNLDNGCRLSIGVASESVVQGFSLDFLYIDEFAYIRTSLIDDFWANIYPTLSNNPNSKCIITSTPNGHNLFYTLWLNAINQESNFIPYRIHWTDVPRIQPLEEFKADTINLIGENGWLMGFELSFDIDLKSIFNATMQKMIREYQCENEDNWGNNDPICNINPLYSDSFQFIDKKIFDYDTHNDYFLISIDIGEGLEQDFSIIKFTKIYINTEKIDKNFNKQNFASYLSYYQVGVFRSNTIAEEDLAELFMECTKMFDVNKLKVIVESNTYGELFFHQIKVKKNYTKNYSEFSNHIFAKFWRQSKNDYDYGLLWREETKKIGIKNYIKLVSSKKFITSHSQTVEEQLNFGRQKNGTYRANYGHDDLVMSDVSMSFFIGAENVYAINFLRETFLKLMHQYLIDMKKDELIDLEAFKQVDIELNGEKKIDTNIIKTESREFHIRDHQKELDEKSKNNCIIYF